MRIFITYLFLNSVLGLLSLKAQDVMMLRKKVSINHQSEPLNKVLSELSKQTACYFSYDANSVKGDSLVTLQAEDQTLETILITIFTNKYQFIEFKNQVIILNQKIKFHPEHNLEKEDTLYRIKGRIIDEKEEGLPHASIHISNTYLGTSTNRDGHFSFGVEHKYLKDTLIFSFIGHQTVSIPINHITDDTTVVLKTKVIPIQEVLVRNTDPVYIVNKAIDSYPKYALTEGYAYKAYYREFFKKDQRIIEYSEAIIDGYKYRRKFSIDQTSIKKSRNIKQLSSKDTVLVKLKGGLEACSRLNILKSPPDFFDQNRNELYSFHYSDIVIQNNRYIYVISFEPKEHQNNAQYGGTLYIDCENYALVKSEYWLTKKSMKELEDQLIIQNRTSIKVNPIDYLYQVDYAMNNGTYYAKRLSGTLKFQAKLKNKIFGNKYVTSFEMVVTSIDPSQKNILNRTQTIKTNSIFSNLIREQDKKKWENENILLPETEAIQLSNQSAIIIYSTEAF